MGGLSSSLLTHYSTAFGTRAWRYESGPGLLSHLLQDLVGQLDPCL